MQRLDRYFGVHQEALALGNARLQILASNIANAATPHFKARDIDFDRFLQKNSQPTENTNFSKVISGSSYWTSGRKQALPLAVQHTSHMAARHSTNGATLLYRDPVQSSLDGNTVELATEQLQFTQAAVRYRTSLSFLNGRISSLMTALKSE